MKKNFITVLASLSVLVFFAGCSQNTIQDKTTSSKPGFSEKHVINRQNISVDSQNKTTSNSNIKISNLKNSYPVKNNIENIINSKLDNGEEFIQTFNTLKNAVINNNKKTISDYINYPITIKINNTTKVINSQHEFIKNYDIIITPKVKSALIKQQLNNINITPNGVKIGNGEMWMNLINNGKHEYGISAINNN